MSESRNPESVPSPASSAPDEPIRYPVDHVIGVLDTREQAQTTVQSLTSHGFLESEVHVVTGPTAADALHATTGRSGLTDLAVRIATRLGVQDDEMEFKSHYEEAMREGRYVVLVAAASDERKDRATALLRDHGAHSVSFHGRFTIEGIVPPRAD